VRRDGVRHTVKATATIPGRKIVAEQDVARQILEQLEGLLRISLIERVRGIAEAENGDFISALCMTCAQNHLDTPRFTIRRKDDGAYACHCIVSVNDVEFEAIGMGTDKRAAKQKAAEEMLSHDAFRLEVEAYMKKRAAEERVQKSGGKTQAQPRERAGSHVMRRGSY